MNRFTPFAAAMVAFSLGLAGCVETYVSPGPGADLSAVGVNPADLNANTPLGIRQELEKKPLARFPTAIAVARIQSAGYRSQTAESWGTGRYSIVATRDIEDDATVAKLRNLPQVSGIAVINRMLLPEQLHSDEELRNAAARLHADMLLIYTIDTKFYSKDAAIPLTAFTLGLAPDQQLHVVSTASAVLMDTRDGYVYAVSETTNRDDDVTQAIFNDVDLDRMRLKTEKGAFNELVADLIVKWPAVVSGFDPTPTGKTTP